MIEQVSMDDWQKEGTRRFGGDFMAWKFVCPSCGHVATPQDWDDLGAPRSMVAYACVGNWMAVAAPVGTLSKGPCIYQGHINRENPMHVVTEDGTTYEMFAFADPDPVEPTEAA